MRDRLTDGLIDLVRESHMEGRTERPTQEWIDLDPDTFRPTFYASTGLGKISFECF